MDRFQYYLTKLAEESSEVAQIALKTQQFGRNEIMPGQPFTNIERCRAELNDLWAIIELLNNEYYFGYTPDRSQIEAKKEKVKRYLDYSIDLGFVK
jgi:hypothetical protein